eukprot:CAMPEP_0170457412 /NCGR_PEP_ID=MMETSP0123-20130129/4709_1 /TAXON_ID=182087 /ORGANISM="Favella ehrenbergii, Strain Fehren 1" /LENGTH=108 /DNA_ID=CAMNT_0010721189 /DNA_START=153 /DNA_END=479 /DNA_ORIENTATION=-
MILPVGVGHQREVPAQQPDDDADEPKGDGGRSAHAIFALVHGVNVVFLERAIFLHLLAKVGHRIVVCLRVQGHKREKENHALVHRVHVEKVPLVVRLVRLDLHFEEAT